MKPTGVDVFDTTVQKTNVWLKELNEILGGDRQQAYLALRATLQVLRDRLPISEAVDLAAQFPMLVRGFYYENWTPNNKPNKLDREGFLKAVSERLVGAPLMSDPAAVVRAVFGLLERRVSEGEMRDVRGLLPADIIKLLDERS